MISPEICEKLPHNERPNLLRRIIFRGALGSSILLGGSALASCSSNHSSKPNTSTIAGSTPETTAPSPFDALNTAFSDGGYMLNEVKDGDTNETIALNISLKKSQQIVFAMACQGTALLEFQLSGSGFGVNHATGDAQCTGGVEAQLPILATSANFVIKSVRIFDNYGAQWAFDYKYQDS